MQWWLWYRQDGIIALPAHVPSRRHKHKPETMDLGG